LKSWLPRRWPDGSPTLGPTALDLRRQPPRSPKERMGGYVHLARMIDKARAKAAGLLGEYIYPCPLDRALLDVLEVDAETFLAVARDHHDEAVVGWLNEHAAQRSPDDAETWNRAFLAKRPTDEAGRRHFLEIRDRVAPGRTDVGTWVDLLDLEEGREAPSPPRR